MNEAVTLDDGEKLLSEWLTKPQLTWSAIERTIHNILFQV